MEGGSGLAYLLTLALRKSEGVTGRAAEGLDKTKYYILLVFKYIIYSVTINVIITMLCNDDVIINVIVL